MQIPQARACPECLYAQYATGSDPVSEPMTVHARSPRLGEQLEGRREPKRGRMEQVGHRAARQASQVTGKAQSFSEDSRMDLHFRRQLSKVSLRSSLSDSIFLSVTWGLVIAWRLSFQLQI